MTKYTLYRKNHLNRFLQLYIDHTQYPAIALDEKATDINSIISIVNQFPVKVVIVKPFRVGGLDRVQSLIRELKSIDIKVVIVECTNMD